MTAPGDFSLVNNRSDLAAHLSCAEGTLTVAIERASEVYRELHLPKRSPRRQRESRVVYEVQRTDVADALKTFHRRFFDYARRTDSRFPSSHAHGYLPGKSILTNAQLHVGAKNLVRADIANFFQSITRDWVERILRDFRLSSEGAKEVAALLTIEGKLPLGLPSSPLIANLACISLDEKLGALAVKSDCRYTRYADDLSFSGAGALPSKIEIASVLAEEGFSLAERKYRQKKRGQSFYVTGLSISEPDRPRVARPLKQRLRQELRFIETYGLKNHLARRGYSTFQKGINRIDGLIRYVRGIERDLGVSYQRRWEEALAVAGASPNYLQRPDVRVSKETWLVDESVVESPNGHMMMVSLVVVEDTDYVEAALDQELARLRADAFYPGAVKKLQTKGLHFVDLPEDARAALASRLQGLPLRGYVVLDREDPSEKYEKRFLRLLGELLARRFSAAAGAEVRLLVEENPSVPKTAVADEVSRRLRLLESTSSRRPSRVETTIVAKATTTLIAVPDLLMGFLYAYLKPDAQKAARQRFERLRDKFRTIRSLGDRRTYGRRMPIAPWTAPAPAGPPSSPTN